MSNPKREIKKIEFVFSSEQLVTFLEKLTDLTAIDDYIVCKIDNTNFLMYSVATDAETKNTNTILAFKSFTFDTDTIITKKSEIPQQVIYILKDAKKTIRTLKNFADYNEPVSVVITYDVINDLNFGDMMKLKASKLKLNFGGGSPRDSNIKISLKSIKDKSTPETLEFKFNITKEDFDKARKMSLIETENEIIYFTVQNNELSIAENRWALKLQDLVYKNYLGEESDINISIKKKYFKSATCDKNGLDVEVYRTHLIINNDKSSLMISRQMTLR